jgi:hypothetical protein
MVSDFWYSSWVDAGRPNLNSLMTKSFTTEDKNDMIAEISAYKQGRLIENNMLMARKKMSND